MPPGGLPAPRLDSVYVYNPTGDDTAYSFFYDDAGYVVKIHLYDIRSLSMNMVTDSLVYNSVHQLQTVYTIDVNGIDQSDYLNDVSGALTKVNFRPQQQSISHYMLLAYYPGHRVSAMADYVNNTLSAGVTYTYDSIGNLLTEGDTIISSRSAKHYIFDAYDSRPNFTGLLAGLSYFILPDDLFSLLPVNNVLKKRNTDGKVYNYSYEYNSAGFPVKRSQSGTGIDSVVVNFYYSK